MVERETEYRVNFQTNELTIIQTTKTPLFVTTTIGERVIRLENNYRGYSGIYMVEEDGISVYYHRVYGTNVPVTYSDFKLISERKVTQAEARELVIQYQKSWE